MKNRNILLFFLVLLFLTNTAIYFLDSEKGFQIISTSKRYLLEMLSILPQILILVGLFDAWVPKSFIDKAMGRASGIKGILFSFFIGTAAMGPLYLAFPMGLSLLRKGASLFNVSIFLCVWAAIKVPMILFEIKFLGSDFALTRLVLTIPSILAISLILNLILRSSTKYEET